MWREYECGRLAVEPAGVEGVALMTRLDVRVQPIGVRAQPRGMRAVAFGILRAQVQPLVFGLEFLVLGAERSVLEIQLLVGHWLRTNIARRRCDGRLQTPPASVPLNRAAAGSSRVGCVLRRLELEAILIEAIVALAGAVTEDAQHALFQLGIALHRRGVQALAKR